MIKAYFQYRKKRVNAHGLHSPFAFEFYNEIIKKRKLGKQPRAEQLRKELCKRQALISVTDLGAGSKKNNQPKRSISSIAKNAATPRKQGEFMSRLIDFYKLKSGLELGTSLGMGTAYMALTDSAFQVKTIEGCPETAAIAKENFQALKLGNIEQEVGAFDAVLKKEGDQKYDLIYIDGNHQYQPTVDYFEFALAHTHDTSFIIFDDIHWSEEMEEAWKKIIASPQINVSMDFFKFGIVTKRSGQRKQDFVIKF